MSEPPNLPDILAARLARVRALTPARLFAGRAGSSYRTETMLELRADHAAAVDAVHAEFDLSHDLGADFVARWGLLEVVTRATTRAEYLRRPDLGRSLDPASLDAVRRLPHGADLQVVIGDGLSVTAVVAQVPALLPLLFEGAAARGLTVGRPFFVRNARVGVLNDIGPVVAAKVVVLLVGERPGLATADSLSAYLAYRPGPGRTDADRNLVSNIHARGTPPAEASARVLALVAAMIRRETSGVALKEGDPKPLNDGR